MSINEFLNKLSSTPEAIEFAEIMAVIAEHYDYTTTQFTNGQGEDLVTNEAGTNEGSCKLFAFAKAQGLGEQDTLYCFGAYYRDDVLKNPEGNDHANIRNFIKYGWEGITFDGPALATKN